MKLELGSGVVAELRGDEANWAVLHLAAPTKPGRRYTQRLDLAGFMPLEWPTLCGLKGLLYVYGGMIRELGLPICAVCRMRLRDGRHRVKPRLEAAA